MKDTVLQKIMVRRDVGRWEYRNRHEWEEETGGIGSDLEKEHKKVISG